MSAEPPGVAADTDLWVLEALQANPSLSQRQLARSVGLPLSRAHFVLRRLVEKGLVKVTNVARSKHKLGYLYLLTPKGVEAKARLTYRFVRRAAVQYQAALARVDAALGPVVARFREDDAQVLVSLVGDGPLGEVIRDAVQMMPGVALVADHRKARIAVLVDPDVPWPQVTGIQLVKLG